jgi:hypothetical protein
MAIARAHLVDSAVSRWYHFVTPWVRRVFLLADEHQDRIPGSNAGFKNLWRCSGQRGGLFRATRWANLMTRTGIALYVPFC